MHNLKERNKQKKIVSNIVHLIENMTYCYNFDYEILSANKFKLMFKIYVIFDYTYHIKHHIIRFFMHYKKINMLCEKTNV